MTRVPINPETIGYTYELSTAEARDLYLICDRFVKDNQSAGLLEKAKTLRDNILALLPETVAGADPWDK